MYNWLCYKNIFLKSYISYQYMFYDFTFMFVSGSKQIQNTVYHHITPPPPLNTAKEKRLTFS